MNVLLVSDEKDMDRVFQLPPTTYIGGNASSLPLREIINRLEVKLNAPLKSPELVLFMDSFVHSYVFLPSFQEFLSLRIRAIHEAKIQ